MGEKLRIPLAKARALADKVAGALAPHCARLEVAGSIRRGAEVCGDIDLVVLSPAAAFWERLLEKTEKIKSGDHHTAVRMANGVKIDVYVAQPEARDIFGEVIHPCNWGTVLLCRTGSERHNIWFARYCQARGRKWQTGFGIKCGGRWACEEEAHLYEAVGLDYIPPEDRER